jgi:hypothetical protein
MLSPPSPSRHIGSPALKFRGFAKVVMSRRAFSSSELQGGGKRLTVTAEQNERLKRSP